MKTNFCILIIIVLIILFLLFRQKSQEKYGTVMGAAAPYKKQYVECLDECNRSDPNRRLLASGNINCGFYCDSIVTQMAQQGISPDNFPVTNSMTKCKNQCSVPGSTENEIKKCISVCHGQDMVGKWCKELWCPYSLFPEEDCMKQCVREWTTNNNQVSWTWDMEK